ncbi:MAG: radical SAM protein, partial [Bacteroidales bacterium]|nr:radical SAM protein [Bacteroidales bacterium]
SGTIFFSNCNMQCIFCQNCEISQLGFGKYVDFEDLASIMIILQNKGCHNINFVSPSHQILAILKALEIAIEKGLKIPLVYNSGGYDSKDTLILLKDIFDIYMPDFKYFNDEIAEKLSGIKNYKQTIREAITEMHKQVGDLQMNEQGIAYKGLIIRHLILPDNLSQTKEIINFIAKISLNNYLNLMDQYRPEHKAFEIPSLRRRITPNEYEQAVEYAQKKGLKRLAT